MSTTIDERVVEMRFDNKHFENNVQTSLNSINKLKDSLNMTGAAKGLEEIDRSAKSVDMGALGNAVDTVQTKFSALQVMAVTALANITNSAVNAGKRIVTALAIDPIRTGLQEYETQINAVQTILANTESKGTTITDVNKALDELNTYADKTIYNFTEMTRNIGTFTAAGVDLDTSVTAIQGIANLAAVSGSTSQQASTAMYQLSQALSTGTVRLMDWNSVVNAGMGGQVFQDALKETARAHGIAIDDIIEANGSFRESLQEGWLSADILTETLSHFTMAAEEGSDQWKEFKKQLMDSGYTEKQAESILKLSNTATDAATKVKTFTQLWDTLKETAQSGWTQTWEIIFGDFEEAKTFFSDLYNFLSPLIEASSKARNDLLQGWKDAGGRQHLIDSMYNAFEAIKSVIVPVKEAFREIFPPMTVKQLVGFTEGLKNFTESLKLGETASNNLKRTFKGLFATLDIVGQLLSAVLKAIFPMFKGFGDLGGGVLKLTAAWGDWMVKLSETIRKTDIFNKTFGGISKIVTVTVGVFKKFTGVLKEKIISPGIEGLLNILESIRERFSGVGNAVRDMKDGVVSSFDSMGNAVEQSGFVKLLMKLWEFLAVIGKGAVKILGGLASGLVEVLGNANFTGLFDFINSLSFSAIAVFVAKFMKGFTDMAGSLGDFKESALDILDSVKGCFEAYQTQLKAGTLMKIAQAIAILAAAILVISLIDSEKLAASLGAVTVLFADLVASMALFGRLSGPITGVAKSCTAMISISTAVLILAFALKTVSNIDSNKLGTGLLGILSLTAIVVATAKILGKGSKTVLKGAAQMILFAAAIKILASACADLSNLNWSGLAKGLVGVGVLMAEIAIFTRVAKFSGKTVLTATGIVLLASAMKILASACKDFGEMNWSSIGKSLVMVGGLLAEIAIFTNLTGNAKHVISSGIALIAIAAAMKIFASAAHDIAYMSWEEIGKGLVAMAGSLILVTAAVRLMPKNMIGAAIGLIGIASALLILSNVLSSMGSMTWGEIGKGLVALGGSMLILALGLNAMKSTIAGSAAMLVAAAALAILAPVLGKLGNMSWGEIAKGLIAIAGAFVILGVAGYVLSGVVGPILALSGALALVGIGMLAIGAGVTLLSVGITALAATIATSSTAVAAGLTVIVTALVELIPFVITKIGEGLIALCTVIKNGAPAIAEAIMSVILSLCNLLVEAVPVLADTLLKLIVAVFESLVEYTPQIVDLLFQFLVGVLNGIAKNLPDLITAAVGVIMAFFEGVIQALGTIDTDTLVQGIAGIGLISALMIALAAAGALAPAAMAGVIAMGLVIAELAIVLAAIGALAQIPGLEWLISEGGDFLQVVGTAIGQFIGGIVGGVASGVTSQIPQMGTDLSNFMTNIQPFIDGAKAIDPSTMDGVKTLTGIILALTAANILEGLTSWLTGGSSVTKFAEELPILGKGLKGFSDAVVGISPEIVAAAANAAKTLAEMTKTIPNEGGVIGWFAGENSIAKFGSELPILGQGLKGFSDAVMGIVPENIAAAATAAKALTEMCKTIPNEGGVVGWFAGENSVAKFGTELPVLGQGLKGFSDAVAGIIPENVIAAANAAKALAQMADTIPNEGGVAAWFAGENSVASFAGKLSILGKGLKNFATSTAGITPETVTAAANAGKALASMTATIPKEGGIKAWFSGETSIASFAGNLPVLGKGLKGFSESVSGIIPENIIAAANSAKALAEMANVVPKEGGIKAWFTGDNSIAKFGDKLPTLGKGLKGFSESVNGISPENISAASSAGKTLAEMADTAPKDTSHLTSFGTNISTFGTKLKAYFTSASGISEDAITASKGAVEAIKKTTELNSGNIKSAADAIDGVTKALKGMSDIPKDIGTNFKKNMNQLGEDSAEALVTSVENAQSDMKKAGSAAIEAFADGIEAKEGTAKSASSKVAKSSATETKSVYTSFAEAGKYLVQGFANGITANTYIATAKAKAMATAAANAAKQALAIKSPSRVFYQIGDYAGQGFVNALDDYSSVSYNAGMEMADSARKGLNGAINKVADFINSDMDTQPTIRPVLDLSSVESGASAISGLLGGTAVGVSANVGAISTMMGRRNQNGNNAEVVSAINGLRKDLENVNHTTNVIEGITYDDGSNVSEALKTIIQAAKIERRV